MTTTDAAASYVRPQYPPGADPVVFYSCSRKLYWGCEALARNWATLLSLAFPDDERPFQAYICLHCDGWHVGHAPKDAA